MRGRFHPHARSWALEQSESDPFTHTARTHGRDELMTLFYTVRPIPAEKTSGSRRSLRCRRFLSSSGKGIMALGRGVDYIDRYLRVWGFDVECGVRVDPPWSVHRTDSGRFLTAEDAGCQSGSAVSQHTAASSAIGASVRHSIRLSALHCPPAQSELMSCGCRVAGRTSNVWQVKNGPRGPTRQDVDCKSIDNDTR